ncbi:MAG: hypothetical protein D6731_14550 [Planctomycetota bacterium]|nr:MAG: hypothetical protein D6731_14550 [Planctomycetota bacterium]
MHDADGAADLHPLALEVDGLLEQARARAEGAARAARRRELLAALEAGELDAAGHDELIRLEVRDGLPLHREPPRCPACAGPMSEPRADGTVRCARSGEGGDLCRHTDAEGLYACPACGLVVRAWAEGSLPPSPHEPPLVRPERTQCPHCSGRVADWQRHVRRCPKARPVDFPRCAVCDRRGFHRASLRCPRCAAEVARTLCGEPKGPRRRR